MAIGAAIEVDGYSGPWGGGGPGGVATRWAVRQILRALRLRYLLWRRRHPGASFASYYVESVQQKLAAGRAHRTLGTSGQSAAAFSARGRGTLELLRGLGLEPHHRCLEYGCGSLRIGQHLIRYLDPCGYTGVDLTERFFLDGLDLLERGLVARKQPVLAVATPGVIAALRRRPPDFLISMAVLHCVDPGEVDDYLAAILGLTGPQTQTVVSFREWRKSIQMGPRSWSYSIAELSERIARLAPDARLHLVRGAEVAARWDPSRKSLLCIRRTARPAAPGPALSLVPSASPLHREPQRNAGSTSLPKSSSARSSHS